MAGARSCFALRLLAPFRRADYAESAASNAEWIEGLHTAFPNPHMPIRHRSFAGTALLLTCSFALVGASGCKDAPSTGPATAPAAAAAALASGELSGVTFQYPSGWKMTKTPDGKGVNVSGPIDGDWEPNVYFEIQPVQGDPALDEQLVANAEFLATRKGEDYRFRNRSEFDHPNGFKYGRIEYTNPSEGDARIPLQQWSILIPLKKGTRVQIQAAAATDVWSKHQPTFEKIVDSIKLPK